MADPDLATCHCIIGHRSKAKFLVIKHTDRWSPPILKFPSQGSIDFKAVMINEGMMRKYGLDTRVLRPLLSTPHYYCIELELASAANTKNIRAVWADREQYQRYRTDRGGQPDPFQQWLLERESGEIPPLRSPWQVPGWFEQAHQWLRLQFDLLDLRATGPWQQYRVGWNASCLLRAQTDQGFVYFKAGYDKPPGEAAMILALLEKWPEHIVQPLAIDSDRNWLLNRDFRPDNKSPEPETLPDFSRALARIQVESIGFMDKWLALGCPCRNLDYLQAFTGREEKFVPCLQEGGGALSDEELTLFLAYIADTVTICGQLQEYGIPDMLMHQDFRDVNLVLQDGSHRFIDWADVVIGHPFMSLEPIFAQSGAARPARTTVGNPKPIGRNLLHDITSAYLEKFLAFAAMDQLEEAMTLTRNLFPLWGFCKRIDELDWAEKYSPRYIQLVEQVQSMAKNMGASMNRRSR